MVIKSIAKINKYLRALFDSPRTACFITVVGTLAFFMSVGEKSAPFNELESTRLSALPYFSGSDGSPAITSLPKGPNKIKIPTKTGPLYLEQADFCYATTQGFGTITLVHNDGSKHNIQWSLSTLTSQLKQKWPGKFFSFKSAVLNPQYVKKIKREEPAHKNLYSYEFYALFVSGDSLQIPRRQKKLLEQVMDRLSN